MSILDRTLVVKSAIPPEDTKVLWIDMSSDSRSIKLWNANNGRWEPFGEGKNAVLYIKQVLKSKEKEQARKNIDAVSTEDFLNTKEKVDVFLADVDTSNQVLAILKELQESIKYDDTLASQIIQDIIDNRNDIIAEIQRASTAEENLDVKITKETARAVTAESNIRTEVANTVMYTPQSRNSIEKRQARDNIGAVGVVTVTNNLTILENQGKTIFPYIPASKIPTSGGSNIEDRVINEENRAQEAEQKLQNELNVTVKYIPQELSPQQRKQARNNISAVGYGGTYGNTVVLNVDGETYYPEGRATSIKMSNGSDSVEDVLNETKRKVDTFLQDADTSAEAIDKLKELQDYIAEDKSGAAQMLESIGANSRVIEEEIERATNKENEISDSLQSEVERAKQVEMYLESQKANKTGYYENMSVGVSDNLSGRGESSDAEFAMRPSGGENKSIKDGVARINSIHGNSVVWNQQIKNVYRSTLKDGWVARSGASFCSIENGTIKLFYDPNSASLFYNQLIQKVYVEKGDKFFLSYNFKSNNIDKYNNSVHVNFTNGWSNRNWGVTAEMRGNGLGNRGYASGISTFTGDYSDDLKICIWFANPDTGVYNTEIDYTTPLEITNFRFVNLTKMFNGVNVPTTVEEYEALYGNMPDEYNEGTIIDNHTKAIKSVGVNAWDEEWEYGIIDANGNEKDGSGNIRAKNYTKVISGATYYCKGSNCIFACYDKNKKFVPYNGETGNLVYMNMIDVYTNTAFTIPNNVEYVRMWVTKNYGTIYKHDICIHLVHTGYLNGKYFPHESQTRELPTVEGGLKSALNAYDEIRYNVSKDKWEYVKRIGQVDLGTLQWKTWNIVGSDEVQHLRFRAKLGEKFNSEQNDTTKIYNILNKRYSSISTNDTWNYKKGISMVYTNSVELNKEFVIYDGAYTVDDADKLKSDLSGVICNYELEEPIITELDMDISPDYKVWDYGTEEAINSELSTPVKLNLNYGFNAVGQITDNTILIEEHYNQLQEEITRAHQAESALTQSVDSVNTSISDLYEHVDNRYSKVNLLFRGIHSEVVYEKTIVVDNNSGGYGSSYAFESIGEWDLEQEGNNEQVNS